MQNAFIMDTLACISHIVGTNDALAKLKEAIDKAPTIGHEKHL